jgi:hypothetical protein
MGSKTKLTSAAGIPVADNQNGLTAGARGQGLPSAWNLFIVPTVKPNRSPESLGSSFTDQVNNVARNGERHGRK